MENINTKLLDLKKHIGKVSKESTNPFFKSKYMDLSTLLEHVEPLLQDRGLLLLQPLENDVVRTCIIDTESEGSMAVSSLTLPQLTDPQKIGSCITYFRRYTLKSLLGIQEEDDDGNKASKPTPVKTKLTDDQFSRMLLKSDKNILTTASDNYSLTNEQELELINKLENL